MKKKSKKPRNRKLQLIGCMLFLAGVLLLTVVHSFVGYPSLFVWIPGLVAITSGILLITQPRFDDIVAAVLSQ